MNGDLYALFGLDVHADFAAVKKAYRMLSKLYHPDISGDTRTMVLINNAYEVLSDPVKRATYDRTLAIVRQKDLVETILMRPYQNISAPTNHFSPATRRQKTRLWVWMTVVGMASA